MLSGMPGPLGTLPLHEDPFADWLGHVFVADRTQYILLSNTKSLYSTVMFGKGIRNGSQFIERALNSIREFMEAAGQEGIGRCPEPESPSESSWGSTTGPAS